MSDFIRSSLIVLNYDRLDLLRGCLDSLLAATGPADEIIVVDNGSSDGSADAVRADYPKVRLVALPANQYIFGLNAGLAEARGEFVAFLNNDMTVEPDFVDHSVAAFDAPDIFAVCPRILDSRGHEQGSRTAGFWARGLLFYRPLPHTPDPTDCFFAVGGQSFYRRQPLVDLGSIDPLLWPMYHEDIELSYRAWKAGWRIRYAPDAVCHHLGGQTSTRVFTPGQLRSFVRQNEYLTVWKNITDRRLLLGHVALIPFRLAIAAGKRDWPTIVGFARASRRLPATMSHRADARRHALLSDREVLDRVGRIADSMAPSPPAAARSTPA